HEYFSMLFTLIRANKPSIFYLFFYGIRMYLRIICLSFAVLVLVGCTSPCEELANLICDCETTSAKMQACKTQVRLRSSSDFTTFAKDEEVCRQALDPKNENGCTCLALEKNQIERCGMTRK
ncbi:hypothetical protein JYT19_01020, partial [Sulfobacillus acidophilus]|nr:hypothetical protein [Sulfobacillus acidophilus]